MKYNFLAVVSMLIVVLSCGAKEGKVQNRNVFNDMQSTKNSMENKIDTVTVGGG